MNYIFKQKLQLSDLADLRSKPKRILIFEPTGDLGALYAYHLREHNFEIKHFVNPGAMRQQVISFKPHLLIFSVDGIGLASDIKLIAAALIQEFPGLSLISTGYNLNEKGIGELMAMGVAGHINRRLSRPQDLAVVVKTILNN